MSGDEPRVWINEAADLSEEVIERVMQHVLDSETASLAVTHLIVSPPGAQLLRWYAAGFPNWAGRDRRRIKREYRKFMRRLPR